MFDTREGSTVGAAAAESLRALDTAVADLLDAVPAGTAVVACSDHGFGALRADVFVDVALADAGLVTKPAGAGVVARIGRRGAANSRRAAPPRPNCRAEPGSRSSVGGAAL